MPSRVKFVRSGFAAATGTIAALALALAPPSPAQFFGFSKPKVQVLLHHPPNRGVSLSGKKVAFADPVGPPCAGQFANQLMEAFQGKGAVLVERSHLDSILSEHNLQVSGAVDPATAVRIGRLLGPAMMAFVQVTRCDAQQQYLQSSDFLNHVLFISQTQAFLEGSVRLVDLTTGQDIGITTINVSPKMQNSSERGRAEFPAEAEVINEAMRAAIAFAERDYFPWSESTAVDFLDDKQCDMKLAYSLLRSGDLAGALAQSEKNVATCQKDDNTEHQAHAYYNLGITQMLSSQYDAALQSLNQSLRLRNDGRTVQAIAQDRKAQADADAVAQNQAAQAAAAAAAAHSAAAQAKTVAEDTLTNATVIKMVKGGLSDDVILAMITAQPANFSKTPDAMLALKAAGVSDKVIAAMLAKQ